jgi:hypothetical protein
MTWGLAWRLVPRQHWHDYSDVDVVVAVRSFDHNDPPSKFHNAWHAGVPAVLRESAYQANRKRDLDYLEVSSADDVMLIVDFHHRRSKIVTVSVANG